MRILSVDNLDEPWAVSLAETRLDQYIESDRAETDIAEATLSGGISDAQARYNLTNLCPTGSSTPPKSLSSRVCSTMQSWTRHWRRRPPM